MAPTYTVEVVRALKGAPLSILVLLGLVGAPVSNEWLAAHSGYSDKPVAQALMYLREHGYVTLTTRGWQLAGGARQLPLGATFTPDVDPAQLQAEGPLDADGRTLREGVGNSDSALIVVLKDSEKESFNNNNNGAGEVGNSDSLTEGSFGRKRGQGAHVAEVARALMTRGAAAPADDPLPPDLRAAAQRLVERVGLNRDRAELVVARSAWPAATILDQVDQWLAYQHSPLGANLDRARFPWLVAARIEACEPCPADTRQDTSGDKWAEITAIIKDQQQEDL